MFNKRGIDSVNNDEYLKTLTFIETPMETI